MGFGDDCQLGVLLYFGTKCEARGDVSGLYAVCNMLVLADGVSIGK